MEHAGRQRQYQWGQRRQRSGRRALPGVNSNVFFTASLASNYANTTLDGNVSINSLTFSNSGAMGIACGTPATSTLTIAGTGGAIAITVNPGAGAATVSAPVAIGASQTWTNNSASLLTVSGSVTNGGNTLTLAGSGNTTISASSAAAAAEWSPPAAAWPCWRRPTPTPALTAVSGGTLSVGRHRHDQRQQCVHYRPTRAVRAVDNRAVPTIANRVADAAGITLNGGTFTFLGSNTPPADETAAR